MSKETAFELMKDAMEKAGFDDKETVNRLARLAGYACGEVKLTEEEKIRWRQLHVMTDDDRICMTDIGDTTEWILIGLVYEGKMMKSSAG